MKTTTKTPWILAGCGCVSLIAAIALFAAAFMFFQTRTETDASEPDRPEKEEETVVYRNTREGRTGQLAESYVGFEFRYPKTWVVKPQEGEVNFVSVERAVDGQTHENLNVGYFATAGDNEKNALLYPQLIAQLQNQFAQQFNELQKLEEGATKVGSYDGWQGLFSSTAGDGENKVDIYTRVILLPTPDGTKGVTLLMMGTSLSPDLKAPQDLAVKGELPAVLDSFRFVE